MKNNALALFKISRPVSWLNTAFPFGAMYVVGGGAIDLLFVMGVLYFLVPYNLLMYGVNDVYDYESDLRNPRKGGIEGAKEAKALHPLIVKAALWTNVPFILALGYAGSWVSSSVLALIVFLVVAYSAPPLRLKERPLLDSVTSSLHFVGPLLFALSLLGPSQAAWVAAGAFFLWGVASHIVGAIQDIIPDRHARIASVATALGARVSLRVALVCYAAAASLLITQGGALLLAGLMGLVYLLNIAPYLGITDQTSGLVNAAWRRFIWLNYSVGCIITLLLILS